MRCLYDTSTLHSSGKGNEPLYVSGRRGERLLDFIPKLTPEANSSTFSSDVSVCLGDAAIGKSERDHFYTVTISSVDRTFMLGILESKSKLKDLYFIQSIPSTNKCKKSTIGSETTLPRRFDYIILYIYTSQIFKMCTILTG